MKELQKIQSDLKAPKGQRNTYGKYNYRSCEDILEAVKPLLSENDCTLTISDEVVEVGGRIYVVATVQLKSKDHVISVKGWAREAENKKGMDDAQITGAASSYARKYALNGLFAIDDTKDPDSTNDHGKGKVVDKKPAEKKLPELTPKSERWGSAVQALIDGKTTIAGIRKTHTLSVENEKLLLA